MAEDKIPQVMTKKQAEAVCKLMDWEIELRQWENLWLCTIYNPHAFQKPLIGSGEIEIKEGMTQLQRIAKILIEATNRAIETDWGEYINKDQQVAIRAICEGGKDE